MGNESGEWIMHIDLGEDVTYGSAEPTASLMKKIQDDLKIINDFTVNVDIGTAASFKSNRCKDEKLVKYCSFAIKRNEDADTCSAL